MTELEQKIYNAFLIKKPEFDKAFNSFDNLEGEYLDFPFVMDGGIFNYVRYDVATGKPNRIKYPYYVNDSLDSEYRYLDLI